MRIATFCFFGMALVGFSGVALADDTVSLSHSLPADVQPAVDLALSHHSPDDKRADEVMQSVLPVLDVLPSTSMAISFEEAQVLLNQSALVLSAKQQALANELQAQAVKGLGRPNVTLQARAFGFNQNAVIPLDRVKDKTRKHIDKVKEQHLDQLGRLGANPIALTALDIGTDYIVDKAMHRLPDSTDFDIKGGFAQPSIGVSVPLYTGGLITHTKQIAHLQNTRGQWQQSEQQSLAKLELIKRYFDVQLALALLSNERQTYKAMQLHVDNALKLEQAGLISRGQRMQFEVARNQALRLYQHADSRHQKSLFALRSLLGQSHVSALSTPLFIRPKHHLSWQALRLDFFDKAPLAQKMQLDVRLAEQRVGLEKSKLKPKVFALGEYALDGDNDWFVGVSASYNIFSGLDHRKQVLAAQHEQQAVDFATKKATQDIINLMHSAFVEFEDAQSTHRLLSHNLTAAQENLRIQQLAYQEGMGTVSGVVDAQVALGQVYSEQATNGYRYVMALATLLHHTGRMATFEQYLHHPDNITLAQAP